MVRTNIAILALWGALGCGGLTARNFDSADTDGSGGASSASSGSTSSAASTSTSMSGATSTSSAVTSTTGSEPPEALPGEVLFQEGQVLEIALELGPEAWAELEEHGDREVYLPASVSIAGNYFAQVSIDQVGLRHKGAWTLHHCWDDFGGRRSYAGECQKLSYKLEFHEYDDEARVDGLKRLNLHASSGDATKLREVLAYGTFREFGVDAPRTALARVSINGELQGLFIVVEALDGRYTKAHFPEGGDGNLYKEVWPSILASDADFLEALRTNDEEPDVSDMREFSQVVDAAARAQELGMLGGWVDVEPLLRYLAVDRALKNWDGITAFYSPATPHNFYFYHDDGPDGRFHLIPWDLDNTFWEFDPYMHPEQWVTAAPVPDFNAEPRNCEPRPVWEANSDTYITPPRCDALLDLLAEQAWPEFVEQGEELLGTSLTLEALGARVRATSEMLQPLVEEDPTLDLASWEQSVVDFEQHILPKTINDFRSFLAQGLVAEAEPGDPGPEPTPEELNAPTLDTGLHMAGITNFEFMGTPGVPPNGVWGYADPLSSFGASFNTSLPISGTADLRFDFTFVRGPDLYDEYVGLAIGGSQTDISGKQSIVMTLRSDKVRALRIRVDSNAYTDMFGGIWAEFGIDTSVGPSPTRVVLNLTELYYPDWAKAAWTAGQGFGPFTDDAARLVTLGAFTGLIFGPAASFDAAGEMLSAEESGFLQVDNIYFR